MGAGIAAIGAIASLGQMGYGLYQADKSKKSNGAISFRC